jgi:hypothetical protein
MFYVRLGECWENARRILRGEPLANPFLRYCFVINLDAIGYVINSVDVVEFSTCIFGII